MRWVLLVLLAGPRFEACGSSEGDEGVLPREDLEVCFADLECAAPDPCTNVRCLAGTCTEVGEGLDRDFDGESPIMCGGGDCDDSDPTRFSRAAERCNAIDDDCDGVIDEGARGETQIVVSPVTSTPSRVFRLGDEFGLLEPTAGAVFARALDRNGAFGPPIELFRLSGGTAFAQIEVAASETEALVVARTDLGGLRYAIVASGVEVLESGTLEPLAIDLRVVAHRDDWGVAVDVAAGPAVERRVATRLGADTIVVASAPADAVPPFDLASTGEELVVSIRNTLAFVSEAIVAVDAPGPLAQRCLASGDGSVVVAFDDGFGLSLARYDSAGPLGDAVPGPAAQADLAEISTLGDRIAVLGKTTGGAWSNTGWVLDSSLTRFVIDPIDLGTMGILSASAAPGATALVNDMNGFGGRVALILECD